MSRRPSPTPAQRVGWTNAGDGSGNKCRDAWRHVDGWFLQHCGHPTALHPWALYDREGRMWCAGAAGPARNPVFGAAWDTLAIVFAFVAEAAADPELLRLCITNGRNETDPSRGWLPFFSPTRDHTSSDITRTDCTGGAS